MLAAGYPPSGPAKGTITTKTVPRPDPGGGRSARRGGGVGSEPDRLEEQVDRVRQPTGSSRTKTARAPLSRSVRACRKRGSVNASGSGRRSGSARQVPRRNTSRCPSDHAVALPDNASFDLGAGLGIPAMTAHRALFMDGALPAGAAVLVQGGAGAVGHMAIQLAHRAGARVATTVSSPEKGELARAAGADLVVDYRQADCHSARARMGAGRRGAHHRGQPRHQPRGRRRPRSCPAA